MNAKQELLAKLDEALQSIKCASISMELSYNTSKCIKLPVGYSPEQYEEFLSALDFEYDNGYGGQVLFGRVWLTNDVWLERGEYDGSEWWNIKKLPTIHKELFDKSIAISTVVEPNYDID